MNIKITGLFKAAAKAVPTKNGKTIQKFYLDLDTDTEYPTVCEIQNYDNKVDLGGIKSGNPITVHVNLSGRKWRNSEGKEYFFQSLNAWKIETVEATPNIPAQDNEPAPIAGTEDDQLPF